MPWMNDVAALIMAIAALVTAVGGATVGLITALRVSNTGRHRDSQESLSVEQIIEIVRRAREDEDNAR